MQFYFASARGIMALVLRSESLVLERQRVAERWRSERWDPPMFRHDSRDGWLRPVVASDANSVMQRVELTYVVALPTCSASFQFHPALSVD